ncbi:MAG TPA: 3D-(3,5/4)-trihydroxycyclohexane-1,2-dione acylhydrolase (decyclizing) [Candidatus Marinimicrobia bacterium]|nr:3D-(3,5/4)-trihydroxycyclohexane-1,2-dione acylhydrolase (decyclizing) [Candidatus Neomarinimicrobiota bacterium]HJM70320.1 3D-(3,5/4)-trihydroxycyclohexane-1,2-dione acylhydrolase (decyclizing) [Candidatus Neomarinimicrobiota bacterium]
MRITMSQALVQFMKNQFVERDEIRNSFFAGVWGIFGHGNVAGIGQALEQDGELKHFLPRNEQAMVHAAAAYAKQNRRLKTFACTSSIGPGATNMITGAAGATINRLPVLLLPGDKFNKRNLSPVLQELEHPTNHDITVNDCLKPVSKFWARINKPAQLIDAANEAMSVLTDPALTGAVTLALPQDIQAEAYDYPDDMFTEKVWVIPRLSPDEKSLQDAADLIKNSKSPIIIAGGGVIYSSAEAALLDFCNKTGIPVGETQAGKGSIAWDHAKCLGAIGVTGTSSANILARKSDLVICIGTRLSDFTTASKTLFQNVDVKFLGINVSPDDAIKHSATTLIGDAKVCLVKLTELLQIDNFKVNEKYNKEIVALNGNWHREVDRIFALNNEPLISQGEVIGIVSDFMNDEDTVVCAAGSLPGDMHKLWRTVNGNQYHMEYGYSCMGYEIAGGLGIRLAKDNGDVIVMVGDGSFLMLNSEIVTALQENIKIIIVLINNHGFGSINGLSISLGSKGFGNLYCERDHQTGDYSGNKLPINFTKLAESYGIKGIRVEDRNKLKEALEVARNNNFSYLIEVSVDSEVRVPGYEAWWNVPVAEVSEMPSVEEARVEYEKRLKDEREF